MNKKLAITLVLATTGSAFAGKTEIVPDKGVLEDLWNTKEGMKMLDVLRSEEPIIDEMDPGARCDDISAGKKFTWPVYSTDIAGFAVKLGVTGGIGIVADSTRMAAEASFGPSLRVFAQDTKPIELRLSASTTSTGQNSVDLQLLAFDYMLDSYNIANSTSPLEYINSVGWSLPNAVSGTIGDSYDCSWIPLTDSCSASWSATPLLARVGGIYVLRVNSHGVQAHGLVSATAHSSVSVSGEATAFDRRFAVTGAGVLNFMRGMFWGSATLAPYNSHWIASAESSIEAEDVFGAKVSATLDLTSVEGGLRHFTPYEKVASSYHDLWSYSCSFDKDWK